MYNDISVLKRQIQLLNPVHNYWWYIWKISVESCFYANFHNQNWQSIGFEKKSSFSDDESDALFKFIHLRAVFNSV